MYWVFVVLNSASYLNKKNRFSFALHQGDREDHFYKFNRNNRRKKFFLAGFGFSILLVGLSLYFWENQNSSEDDPVEKHVNEVVGLAESLEGKKKYIILLGICVVLAAAQKYGLIEKVIKKMTKKKQEKSRPKGFLGETPPNPQEIMAYLKTLSPQKAALLVFWLIVSDGMGAGIGAFVVNKKNIRYNFASRFYKWVVDSGYYEFVPSWVWWLWERAYW